MKQFKEKILKSPQTVFRIKDLALLLEEDNSDKLKSKVNYYSKSGFLKRVRKNIYVKDDYNFLELANKLYNPSYISFETVLQQEGVIFQNYETVFVASYLSREVEIEGRKIRYRKLKDEVLSNKKGVVKSNNYFKATKERAFLDSLYLYDDYYFDNLDLLDADKVLELSSIYKQKTLIKKVDKIFKND